MTPAQLTAVLDFDLWHAGRPGSDEQFDPERFGDWIELLAEAGPAVASRTVASIETPLAIAGLSVFIRVLDAAAVGSPASDGVLSDAPGFSGLACDIGGYLVRARRSDAWDAIVALLVALDAGYPDRFQAVMRGCRELSHSAPELDGLDALLTLPEQRLFDLSSAREARRLQSGYAAAADARAFLARGQRIAGDRPARSAVPAIRQPDRDAFEARTGELAWLVNVLVAGCSVQGRAFTPREAADAAFAICRLAIEPASGPSAGSGAEPPWTLAALNGSFPAQLLHQNLITAFQSGWARLYRDVSLFVSERLTDAVMNIQCVDAVTQRHLDALARELTRQHAAGTPWYARDSLDVLAGLDLPAWMSLLGLLSECPVIPAALTAIVEHARGAVSPTAFEFIGTAGQIHMVRAFMDRLPDLLAG
jgi:hypothetical protein